MTVQVFDGSEMVEFDLTSTDKVGRGRNWDARQFDANGELVRDRNGRRIIQDVDAEGRPLLTLRRTWVRIETDATKALEIKTRIDLHNTRTA